MTKNNSKDLTVGSPTGLILGFSLPLLLGMLFQQVYSLMDTIIVGRFLSVSALAAVGSTGSICFLIIGFCQGVCAGFSLPIAQRFGAKDEKGLKGLIHLAVILQSVYKFQNQLFSVLVGHGNKGGAEIFTHLCIPFLVLSVPPGKDCPYCNGRKR